MAPRTAGAGSGSGIEVARAYWHDVVRPVLDRHRPGVPRAAARIGSGSEVLGLDDAMSRDHDWGLRLQVLVPPGAQDGVRAVLNDRLPDEVGGLPTRFALTGRGERVLAVDVLSLEELLATTTGFDPRAGATPLDWLSLTGQAALELTAGEVFEDTDGGLTAVRRALAWYPDDVWRHVVACDWRRLDQELPIMGRAADRGDELGSRVVAARLVDVAVHLTFTLCRRWAPYPKWRGTVLASLAVPDTLRFALDDVLAAGDLRSRTDSLVVALQELADLQDAVGLPSADPVTNPFWDRPYVHIDAGLVPRLLDDVTDPDVRRLPVGLGSVEQRSDNVDLLMDVGLRRATVGADGSG